MSGKRGLTRLIIMMITIRISENTNFRTLKFVLYLGNSSEEGNYSQSEIL